MIREQKSFFFFFNVCLIAFLCIQQKDEVRKCDPKYEGGEKSSEKNVRLDMKEEDMHGLFGSVQVYLFIGSKSLSKLEV